MEWRSCGLKFFSFFWQIRFYAPPRPRVRLNAFYKVLILTPLKQKFNNLGPIPTMASQHEEAKEHDGFRRMSGEDEMMFNNPAPFTAEDSTTTSSSQKAFPPASPSKKEVLRPICMPKPFQI
mmetsp:Transcript_14940/g.31342  ORF Transcript_14940/g.31342 Transcript_14940/m.31342 type:complete len:122 (+) Transcript_14940:36-401(+)